MSTSETKGVVLCILDGWGVAEASETNAISLAAPYWAQMLKNYPNTTLAASEEKVGLPDGQMGNSEVGHMTIGLGRVLMQDLPKIDQAISSGDLKTNEKVLQAIEQLKKTQRPCHLMGLLSPGGVHSHMNHIIEVAKLFSDAGITVHVHGFLDGRDTPPKSAASYVGEFLNAIEEHSNIHLSTLGGRYFAMDRDNRWDRIELAYKAIVQGKAPKFSNAIKQNLLWGDSSANYYYDMLNKKYPNTSTTEDAGILFSAEGINLVQTKINLFLNEGDAATNSPKSFDVKEYNSTSLLNKVIRKNFVASKLDWTNASKIYSKSLEILKPYDSSYVKSLIPFDYILKARSYLDKTDTSSTIEQSLNYAKQSYQLDSKSIITIQTIMIENILKMMIIITIIT
jgi:hypothetical protein